MKKTITDEAKAHMQTKRREAADARRAAGMKSTYTPVERALDDPTSKSKAIVAKCWDCQGGDADPCVSWRIGNCTIKACPLHPVRPHQRLFGTPTPKALVTQFDAPA